MAIIFSNHLFFVVETASEIQEKINIGCADVEPSVKTITDCAVSCYVQDQCIGISVDEKANCFIYRECPNVQHEGRITPTTHRYLMKSTRRFPCFHDGVWQEEIDRCECKYGWIGRYCDKLASSCLDLTHDGYADDNHFVNLDLNDFVTSPIWVNCHVKSDGRDAYIRVASISGQHKHNYSYAQFVEGFRTSDDKDLWIGLENLSILSQAGYIKMHINVVVKRDHVTIVNFYERALVQVSDASTGYALTVEPLRVYSQGDTMGFNYTDCLKTLEGFPFSTWDNDQDSDPDHNCAAQAGTGWWFKGCHAPCNLLGRLFGLDAKTLPEEVMKLPGVDLMAFSADNVRSRWFVYDPY